jgi:hypothetical protein
MFSFFLFSWSCGFLLMGFYRCPLVGTLTSGVELRGWPFDSTCTCLYVRLPLGNDTFGGTWLCKLHLFFFFFSLVSLSFVSDGID